MCGSEDMAGQDDETNGVVVVSRLMLPVMEMLALKMLNDHDADFSFIVWKQNLTLQWSQQYSSHEHSIC